MYKRRDVMGTTGRTAGLEKSGIHLTTGREQYSVSGGGGRLEQRPMWGRVRKFAVVNETHPEFPFPSRPVPDPTTFFFPTQELLRARPLARNPTPVITFSVKRKLSPPGVIFCGGCGILSNPDDKVRLEGATKRV